MAPTRGAGLPQPAWAVVVGTAVVTGMAVVVGMVCAGRGRGFLPCCSRLWSLLQSHVVFAEGSSKV